MCGACEVSMMTPYLKNIAQGTFTLCLHTSSPLPYNNEEGGF